MIAAVIAVHGDVEISFRHFPENRRSPHVFAKVNPKNNAPVMGNLVCAIFCLVGPFLGLGIIGWLTTMTAACCTGNWVFCTLSCLILRFREPNMSRPWKVPGGITLIWIALIFSCLIFLNTVLPIGPGFMGPQGITALGCSVCFAAYCGTPRANCVKKAMQCCAKSRKTAV